jgi:hypothetical protein
MLFSKETLDGFGDLRVEGCNGRSESGLWHFRAR